MNRTMLVLSPHSDDGELGMGGTIAKLVAGGDVVHNVIFSFCDSVELPKEANASAVHLGHKVIALDYPVRNFHRHRQQILEDMIKLRNDIDPETVFIPSSDDVHQDHQVIRAEARRAFKHCSIFGYELPWNIRSFTTSAYSKLGELFVEAKASAIAEYKTQEHRRYTKKGVVISQAIFRGCQCNADFAEAFEVIRFNI